MAKKSLSVLCGLLLLGAVLPPARAQQAQAEPLKLTLEECVIRALRSNIGVQVAVLGPQSADLSVAQAKEKYFPSLTFGYSSRNSENAAYSWLDVSSASVVTKMNNIQGQVSQAIPLGGTFSMTMSYNKNDTNQRAQTINPRFTSTLSFSFSQPLLQGFGTAMANRDIIVARNNLDISEIQFASTVQDTIYSVTQAYWNLVYTTENLKVQQTSLQLARDLLAKNQRSVEIGQLAPLDIVSAQSEVASREAGILAAEAAVKNAEDQLRTLLNIQPEEEKGKSGIAAVDQPSVEERTIPLEEALATALAKRPDLRMGKLEMQNQNLSLAYAKNQLLPQLNLTAGYSSPGVAGTRILYENGNALTGAVIGTVPGGFSDAFKDTVKFKYPNWNVGLTLSVGLNNYLSRANYAMARVNVKSALLSMQNTELQAVLEVKTSLRLLETNYKQIQAYRMARQLAEQKLAAEEEKRRVGMSTDYIVLQYQRDLTTARIAELQTIISYNLAQVNLDRSMGILLEKKNIKLAEIGR